MTPPGYLERFGFNPLSEFKRLQQLSPSERIQEFVQQRESYLNHVTEDAVVSIPYYYWLNNNGELFSSSSRREIFNIKNQVSFFERNGLFYPGIILAATMAKKNPNTLIALYSPTGKKLFDNASINNIQPEMLEFLKKPYDIGQLFFLYFDGVKINNVAVTINNNVNPWLQEMMPEFTNIEAIPDEEEKIVSYLNRPTNLGGVGNFFNRVWQNNHLVFSNVHGQKFFLDEVLRKMGEKLSGKWKISINPGDKTLQALQNYEINTELIIRGYLETVRQYMITHRQTTIPFGGGCGGTTSSLSEIESILGLSDVLEELKNSFHFPKIVSSFSTTFREIRQLARQKKWEYHMGYCALCRPPEDQKLKEVGPCNICKACEK